MTRRTERGTLDVPRDRAPTATNLTQNLPALDPNTHAEASDLDEHLAKLFLASSGSADFAKLEAFLESEDPSWPAPSTRPPVTTHHHRSTTTLTTFSRSNPAPPFLAAPRWKTCRRWTTSRKCRIDYLAPTQPLVSKQVRSEWATKQAREIWPRNSHSCNGMLSAYGIFRIRIRGGRRLRWWRLRSACSGRPTARLMLAQWRSSTSLHT